MLTQEEIEERFKELLKNAPDDDFGRDIRQNASNFSLDQKEFLIDKGNSSDRVIPKINTLLITFYINCREINKDQATDSNYMLFPIQLWIIFDEVRAFLLKNLKSAYQFKGRYGVDDEFINSSYASYNAVEDLRKLFSDDELLMIEWLRIEKSHLTVSKYHIQPNAKGFSTKLNNMYRADVRVKISTELEKHSGDIRIICKYLVKTLAHRLDKAHEAVKNLKECNER